MVKQRFSFIIAFVLVLIEIGLDQLGFKSTIVSIALFSIAGLLIFWAIFPFMKSIYTETKAWSEAKKTLLVIGSCLIIIIIALNTIIYLKMRMWNPNQIVSQSLLTPKQIEAKVQNWLLDSDYSIHKVKDESSHFNLGVSNKVGDNITIKLSKSQNADILVQFDIIPTEEEKEAINKLNTIELNKLLADIKTSLVSIGGLSWEVKEPLKIVILKEVVFVETLTKANFLKALMRLKNGRATVTTSFYTVSANL